MKEPGFEPRTPSPEAVLLSTLLPQKGAFTESRIATAAWTKRPSLGFIQLFLNVRNMKLQQVSCLPPALAASLVLPGPALCSLLPLIQCSVYLTLALPWDGLFCCLELSGSSCMCDCLAYHVVLLSWDRLECELHNGKSCLCFILFLKCF